jgi:hypothetical protein
MRPFQQYEPVHQPAAQEPAAPADAKQAPAEPVYLPERIVAHRNRSKRTQFRVHWLDYPDSDDTWHLLTEDVLVKNPFMVRDYMQAHDSLKSFTPSARHWLHQFTSQ